MTLTSHSVLSFIFTEGGKKINLRGRGCRKELRPKDASASRCRTAWLSTTMEEKSYQLAWSMTKGAGWPFFIVSSAPQPWLTTTLYNPETMIIELDLITCRQKGEKSITPMLFPSTAPSEANEGRLMRLDREDERNCNEREAGRQYAPHFIFSVNNFDIPGNAQKQFFR